jgi:hypothetical protein
MSELHLVEVDRKNHATLPKPLFSCRCIPHRSHERELSTASNDGSSRAGSKGNTVGRVRRRQSNRRTAHRTQANHLISLRTIVPLLSAMRPRSRVNCIIAGTRSRRATRDSLPWISLGTGLFTPYLYSFDESIISLCHGVLSEPRGPIYGYSRSGCGRQHIDAKANPQHC